MCRVTVDGALELVIEAARPQSPSYLQKSLRTRIPPTMATWSPDDPAFYPPEGCFGPGPVSVNKQTSLAVGRAWALLLSLVLEPTPMALLRGTAFVLARCRPCPSGKGLNGESEPFLTGCVALQVTLSSEPLPSAYEDTHVARRTVGNQTQDKQSGSIMPHRSGS